MITELISHEELLEAVHEASIQYVEADSALRNYRLDGFSAVNLDQLKRDVASKERSLREAQTQLLLSTPH